MEQKDKIQRGYMFLYFKAGYQCPHCNELQCYVSKDSEIIVQFTNQDFII